MDIVKPNIGESENCTNNTYFDSCLNLVTNYQIAE